MSPLADGLKRTLDVAGALVLGLATAPLLALAALAVRVSMGSPVLYRQVRAGRHGRLFTLVKLRTMRPTVAGHGVLDALASDGARLTALGRLLRATSVDELPQLWNVLRGDMALVGPRPLLPEYLPRYSPERRAPRVRRASPVSRRSARGSAAGTARARRWYHRSLRLDASILCATALAVLRRDGVNANGHATMPEFQGAPR